jgi:hypothetical protein
MLMKLTAGSCEFHQLTEMRGGLRMFLNYIVYSLTWKRFGGVLGLRPNNISHSYGDGSNKSIDQPMISVPTSVRDRSRLSPGPRLGSQGSAALRNRSHRPHLMNAS